MPQALLQKKKSVFAGMLGSLAGNGRSAQEKARLEAFLNSFPGDYCGFYKDGSVVYSAGFCALFGLERITSIEDIQSVLSAGDSSALEGQFLELQSSGHPFSIRVSLAKSETALRLQGMTGVAGDQSERFFILWAHDISDEADTLQKLKLGREAAEKELALFQSALETCPYAIWIRDATGDLIWANKAYSDMLGTVREDVCTAQLEIVLSPKNKPVRELARHALTTGKPQAETTHVIVRGSRRWMEIRETPLPGTNCTLGTAHDRTSEEDAVGQLERHRNATKILLEHVQSAIVFFSAAHTLEFYNSAFSSQWNLDEQWLNTKPKLGDILEKLRENRLLPEQTDFRKYKQSWIDMFTRLIDPQEDMMYLPDGSAVRLMVIPHPMGGLMMTFEDVTSRLALESSYNTLMAVQRETLDNLAEGVVVYGGDGRVRLWNPSFLRIWALDDSKMSNDLHISAIISQKAHFFAPERWNTSIKDMLIEQGLERTSQNGWIARDDGIYIRYATVPLPDGGVMVSYYDVTDTLQVEKALREKNEALEAAEQLKTDFLANVSYQLRTPLNAIMGFAEILNHQYFGALNERQKEYTNGIHDSGIKLVSLIDDILDLSSIEAGYFDLVMADVAVAPMLENLYGIVSDWAGKQGLSVRLKCSDNIGVIHADERRLRQALLKILQNAINFTPEKGTVILEAQGRDDDIIITIADTGVGIEDTHLATIFQPFDKNSTSPSQRNNSGAGLGLALVKKIVELHNGIIEIESKKDQGTIVRMTLPRQNA